MKKKTFYRLWLLLCVFVGASLGDTFKHKETGEIFNGFVTQKSTAGMTRVYNSTQKKFVPVNLNEYEVTLNAEGRRQNVVLVPILQAEVLMSQTVAEQVAQTIVDASNAGPLAVIIQIDSPGGRGEYMRTIAAAITQANHCPMIAYISGGTYGGAFNAAAIVALSCDKIFVAPTTSIGAIGPLVGSSRTTADYTTFLETYAPETLSTYSTYVTALAQEHNRPQALARALIDRKLAVIEVTNTDGSSDFILRDDRQPNQTIVRTLAEGAGSQSQTDESTSVSAVDVIGAVLNLTAAEAVRTGLADGVASSRQEVLDAMGIAAVPVVPAQGIDNVIKKFTAAKRNISAGLAQIERLEAQASLLDESLQQLQQQLTTGTETRETLRVVPRQRVDDQSRTESRYSNSGTPPSTNYPASSRERVTSVQPVMDPIYLQNQMAGVLRQLINEYRRVYNLAERWPGGLPISLSLSTLQANLNSATAQLNNLYNMNLNIYNQGINTTPQGRQRGY